MRFAWLRSIDDRQPPRPTLTEQLILAVYNIIWWVPAVLSFTGVISYRAGFVAVLTITVTRALINAYRINLMSVEAAERLPLRQP